MTAPPPTRAARFAPEEKCVARAPLAPRPLELRLGCWSPKAKILGSSSSSSCASPRAAAGKGAPDPRETGSVRCPINQSTRAAPGAAAKGSLFSSGQEKRPAIRLRKNEVLREPLGVRFVRRGGTGPAASGPSDPLISAGTPCSHPPAPSRPKAMRRSSKVRSQWYGGFQVVP